MKDQFYKHIENLQDSITSKIEEVDGLAKFEEDIWQRQEGGGGRTRVIENGAIFEKGGVNISAVHGELPEILRKQFNVDEGNVPFQAELLSSILSVQKYQLCMRIGVILKCMTTMETL